MKALQKLLKTLFFTTVLVCSHALQAFELQNTSGERVNLLDYIPSEQWTLVMFWSTDCIPCEQQKPMIEAFYQERQAQAGVVGVAIDGMRMQQEINRLIDHHQPSYPNLVAFDDVFHRQYQELTGKPFRATPTYLLFDPQGQLAGARSGVIDRALLEGVIAAR